jgi:DNA-directed RNA polymerase specialized sigma24 family protein
MRELMEMMMFKTNQIANVKNMEYATAADFCKIFDKDMNSLYLLSLLLTGDHDKAEQCFVEGLENAVNRNRVFREWARSWARRAIIQNALRIINPGPNGGTESWDSSSINRSHETSSECVEIAAVIGLEPFERFVFVMSVLEDYSDHDCSILLGCTRRDVLAARSRALQRIGDAAGLHRRLKVTTDLEEPLMNDSRSVVGAAA